MQDRLDCSAPAAHDAGAGKPWHNAAAGKAGRRKPAARCGRYRRAHGPWTPLHTRHMQAAGRHAAEREGPKSAHAERGPA